MKSKKSGTLIMNILGYQSTLFLLLSPSSRSRLSFSLHIAFLYSSQEKLNTPQPKKVRRATGSSHALALHIRSQIEAFDATYVTHPITNDPTCM